MLRSGNRFPRGTGWRQKSILQIRIPACGDGKSDPMRGATSKKSKVYFPFACAYADMLTWLRSDMPTFGQDSCLYASIQLTQDNLVLFPLHISSTGFVCMYYSKDYKKNFVLSVQPNQLKVKHVLYTKSHMNKRDCLSSKCLAFQPHVEIGTSTCITRCRL